jgi:hypothetical protein
MRDKVVVVRTGSDFGAAGRDARAVEEWESIGVFSAEDLFPVDVEGEDGWVVAGRADAVGAEVVD